MTQVITGFPIVRTAAKTMAIYEDLKDEDGSVITASNDWDSRQGNALRYQDWI